jgi:hypothetical protein
VITGDLQKAYDEAIIVFSQKVKLSFCYLVEKIEALVVGVFLYFFYRLIGC